MNDSDADDLCQEVFVIVFRKIQDFEQKSSLRTWLYGIAVRVALAHRRKAQTQRELPTATLPEVETNDGPHDRFAEREARKWLDMALDTLDEKKRAVFVLYEIEQLSMNEVAQALECPLQTAYSRLHAAREQVEAFFRQTTKGQVE
ncbi:RNA polymerase sigma factor [Pendulispora albinea]|uniref:RNA polymerase sigma factor n=1 Tax=Pendulispora albinea TaxID=2741071 RepID=A0ABZ2M323_9BACT